MCIIYVRIVYQVGTNEGAVRRHFGKQMNKETKLRIHNITAKAALKFGSEAWVLKKREEQRLEAAQFLKFKSKLANYVAVANLTVVRRLTVHKVRLSRFTYLRALNGIVL